MLGVMQSPFGAVLGHTLPSDYTQFLDANSLEGKIDRRRHALLSRPELRSSRRTRTRSKPSTRDSTRSQDLGATLVDCDTGDIFAYGGDEFTVLLQEFKVQIADYLATL